MRRGKTVKVQYFSLVEIGLAILVISIGLMAVMGLFPVGLDIGSKSMGKNLAADAADNILHELAAQLKEDWTLGGMGSLKDNIAGAPFDLAAPNSSLPDLRYGSPCDLATPPWEQWGTTAIYYLPNFRSKCVVLRYYQEPDFDAVVRIWKTPITTWTWNGATWAPETDSLYANRVQLNIQIAWPLEGAKHEDRKKVSYAMEVAKTK